jgi:hypothetical protein
MQAARQPLGSSSPPQTPAATPRNWGTEDGSLGLIGCRSSAAPLEARTWSPPVPLMSRAPPPAKQVVKVYVSVYSDDRGRERAISNLKRIEP